MISSLATSGGNKGIQGKMKTKILAALAVVLVCAAFATQANAVPIVGKVDFFGNLTTNTNNLNTATAFTSFTGVTVVSNAPFTPTGSYAGTGGASVSMNSFTFKPTFTAPVPNLWSFTVGVLTYTFNLTSVTSVIQPGDNTLTVVGNGIATITGGGSFDPTPGQFFISTQGPAGPSFTFSATTVVPEGGSALALLGIGVIAIELIRRKMATC
jgi:hypothetical protein